MMEKKASYTRFLVSDAPQEWYPREAISDFERKFKVSKVIKVTKCRGNIKVNGNESPYKLPEMYKSLVRTSMKLSTFSLASSNILEKKVI